MNAKIDKLKLALEDAKTTIKSLRDGLRSLKADHKAELKIAKSSTAIKPAKAKKIVKIKAVKKVSKKPAAKKVTKVAKKAVKKVTAKKAPRAKKASVVATPTTEA